MSEIFTLEKIYRAYLDCRKRKKNTINALKFEIKRESNLIDLLRELKSKRYNISRHICFVMKDPLPREIFAADFRDRIVHHLLYNEISYLFENDFISNSLANRTNKGTHEGVKILKDYLKVSSKGSYFLKLDVKSFFCTIDKDILFKIVYDKIISADKSNFWKKDIIWLCQKIIFHNPVENCIFRGKTKDKNLILKEKSLFFSGGRGLPIGNLTSQFFANVYLDCLDHFIIDILGVKQYIRYVDDMLILNENKETLIDYIKPIEDFLKNQLRLKIKKNKTRLQPTNKGIDFLGYFVKPSHVLVRRKVVCRFKNKLYNIEKEDAKKVLAIINSYYGHFIHAFTYNLRKDIYENHLGKLKENFLPKDFYFSLKHVKK